MALVGRTTGAMMSGFAALALETSVDRSVVFSGNEIVSTTENGGFTASTAAWNCRACVWPKRSLEYMRTTRLGETLASAKISVMNCTAFLPKTAVVTKLR